MYWRSAKRPCSRRGGLLTQRRGKPPGGCSIGLTHGAWFARQDQAKNWQDRAFAGTFGCSALLNRDGAAIQAQSRHFTSIPSSLRTLQCCRAQLAEL